METGSLNHPSQQQNSALIEEVFNILKIWVANEPIGQVWPMTGIYNPLIIRAYQAHVRQYQISQKGKCDSDMTIINLFLKKGQKICEAYVVWEANRGSLLNPDNIIIDPLQEGEHPRNYVARAYEQWKAATGSDAAQSEVELRRKIEGGLPQTVQNMLDDVIGLPVMSLPSYTAHVVHFVDQDRKTVAEEKTQDLDTRRKLMATQLALAKLSVATQATIQAAIQQQVVFCGAQQVVTRFREGSKPKQPPAGHRKCYRCGSRYHFVNDCWATVQQSLPLRESGSQRAQLGALHSTAATAACTDTARVVMEHTKEATTILPGDTVYLKVFRRKWNQPRYEGPHEVVKSTGVAVQIKDSPKWINLRHCIKAPANIPSPQQVGVDEVDSASPQVEEEGREGVFSAPQQEQSTSRSQRQQPRQQY